MFDEDEETQYCPMCEEWAQKYEKLKKENMISFDEHFKENLKNDKEYAIMWLESVIDELKVFIEVMKDENN